LLGAASCTTAMGMHTEATPMRDTGSLLGV
jgi:hypothetical protein